MTNSMGSVQYTTKITNSLAKNLTVFVGLVVDSVLDAGILKDAARELIARWPILGGHLKTKVLPCSGLLPGTIKYAYVSADKLLFIQTRCDS